MSIPKTTEGAEPDPTPDSASPVPGASEAARPRKKSQQALDDYLSALFPMPDAGVGASGRAEDTDAAWIERARIEPNPAQPRRTWSAESLRELGLSLARDGQLQACVVRPHPAKDGFFQLVSGERRWRASAPEFANLERLRCTIRAVSDEQSLKLALVENLQREDLNDIDKARAFVDLRDTLRLSDPRVTWSHVAHEVGLSREYLQRLKALLDLPLEVQEMVRGGALSGRSARALCGLRDGEAQKRLALEIQHRKLSSDQALERVRALAAAPRDALSEPPSGAAATDPARVTRESQRSRAVGGGENEAWEEALRQAVQILAQARRHPASRTGKRSKKSRRLIEQARAHIEAMAGGVEE